MDVLYPPFWPLISAIIFTAIVWMTGTMTLRWRRLIRVCSFIVLFMPGAIGAHGAAVVFPLALVPVWMLIGRFNLSFEILLAGVLSVIVSGVALVRLSRKRRSVSISSPPVIKKIENVGRRK